MFRKKSLDNLLSSALVFMCICYFSVIATAQRGKDLGKPATDLEAKLLLYKDQYLLREPIWVEITVTNKGEEEGWFYFARFAGFKIKDSKGQEYACHVSISTAGANTIKPKETFEYETNLLLWYGEPEDSLHVQYYLPPEKYNVFYLLDKKVTSEKYQFEVVHPKLDELDAMNLIKEAYNLMIDKKWDESSDKFKEIIRKYPNSEYTSYAMLRVANTLEDLYQLIEKFPHSREAVRVVSSIAGILKNKKDKQGFIEGMNGLVKRYPDTDIAKEAQKQLEKLDELKFE